MRVTFTIDDDVAATVKALCRRTGESLESVLNRFLRDGLSPRREQLPMAPFRVQARPLGLRAGVQIDNVAALLEQLDDPSHP